MKFLVHLHAYYQDMIPEILSYIQILPPEDYELFVTLNQKNQQTRELILKNNPKAQIQIVSNRGYDLAPFLSVIKQVNLNNYDFVLKLHTKRDLPAPAELPSCRFQKDEWRNCLLGFLRSSEIFSDTLKMFEKFPQIGMISHRNLLMVSGKEDREANRRAAEIMQLMGLRIAKKQFVAGTMFICRAKLMQPLQKLPYTDKDFDVPMANHQGGTLAHALERVLGWMILAQGYKIGSYEAWNLKAAIKKATYKLKRFLYRKHTNSKGVTHIKICKIPVYKSRIYHKKTH